MLQPNDRRHLFESLRPPEDYSLDYAIGTTFTLELLALLTAPLAFTTFSWADEDGHLSRSPQALLATMQQYADRITLFCQTGKIAIPNTHSLLYSYLEDSVVEVNAPKSGGIFHPKIWVLRFTAPEQPVLYRFLCLSRNLTFDRSWDTILVLDGHLAESSKEIAANRPLSNFIAALPQLAHNLPIAERVQTNIDRIQIELRRVQFELPPGFDQLLFHPLGLKGNSKAPINGQIDRLLVVSPFVSEKRLNQLEQQGKSNILISRPEALDQISATTLGAFAQLYQISPAANPETDEGTGDTPAQAPLVGLHAKLYIADAGKNTRIWTGSANATDAAFDRNVEFLVELIGSKQKFGIDALLAFQENEVSFRSLLEPFTPPPEPTPIVDVLDNLVNFAERKLLKFHLTAHVLPTEEPNQYCLQLRFEGNEQLEFTDILVCCYPMTRHDLATPLDAPTGNIIEFKSIACQDLTSFFAFEIWTSDGKKKLSSFLFNVPLEGVPANRKQEILRWLLKDKNQVLKLLLFLLAEGKADSREPPVVPGDPLPGDVGSNGSSSSLSLFPLFEAMVRALDRNPMKLDHIARLVDDLRQPSPNDLGQPPPADQLLPDNFEEIWQPIYAARQRLNP
jgi:hypothetical protein